MPSIYAYWIEAMESMWCIDGRPRCGMMMVDGMDGMSYSSIENRSHVADSFGNRNFVLLLIRNANTELCKSAFSNRTQNRLRVSEPMVVHWAPIAHSGVIGFSG